MLKIAGLCVATLALGFSASIATAANGPPKIVAFQRLVQQIPAGTQWMHKHQSILCYGDGVEVSNGERREIDITPYLASFRSSFKGAGLNPEEEANLFAREGESSADYALAGIVTDERLNVCMPVYKVPNYAKDPLKGEGSMTVEWQLYSRLEGKVVAQVKIISTYSTKDALPGGASVFAEAAFGENLKILAADPAIHTVLAGAGMAKGEMIKPVGLAPIIVAGVHSIVSRPIDEANQSVVVIYAGDTLGSGVLISKDGYLLTDAHVVGDSPTVRIRWADGKEGVATVVRTSKLRDVALLKTDAGGRNPLPMQDTLPPVGSTVYAVGSPEGQQFAGTLTRGVVSSARVMNGLNYIQSDVTTGHGGSGGPLLDEKGYVIGLTDLAYGHDATSSGLNFFTPVKDALQFLGIDLR
jgi:serine protease Do